MRQRVKVSSKAVLQPIQLAAIAISTAFQKRRALCQGMSAFIRAAIITQGTCTIVFTARSSVPKTNRAPVHSEPLDFPEQPVASTHATAPGCTEQGELGRLLSRFAVERWPARHPAS